MPDPASGAFSSLYVLGYAEVPVNVAAGGSIIKRERIPVYGDDPRHYPPLLALALNPEMVEWLLNELEFANRTSREDGFVTELRRLRDEMKEGLWTRTAA